MKFTKEMIEKAKAAKSAEELVEMAKAEGVELTAEEAKQMFENLHKSGELADEELDNVSGGCGGPSDSGDTPKYSVGQEVERHVNRGSYTVIILSVSAEKKSCGGIVKSNVFTYDVQEKGGKSMEKDVPEYELTD